MRFQLPKPMHGWRQFTGEVAIIVLGVLIALGAEQLVEAAHWNHLVELERSALRSEVRDNLNAVQTRMTLEPCVQARLAELEKLVDLPAAEASAQIAGRVGLPLPAGASSGAWSIALAGEALSHMSLEEQLDFSNAFSNYENWDAIRREERQAWLWLAVLDHARALTDADWVAVRQAVAEAVAAGARVSRVGPFIFRTAAVGEKPDVGKTPAQLFAMWGYGSEICEPILRAPPRGRS